MMLLHLLRHFAKHTIENLVSQINRFFDRLSGWHNPDVDLLLARQSDSGDKARTEIDHSPIDSRQMCIWVEHQIARVRLW
jgi:hypothetical protein